MGDEMGLILRSDLGTAEAQAVVGRTLAEIEEDCSQSWPTCPRPGLICDCRLRAVRACNALRHRFTPPSTTRTDEVDAGG